MCKTCTGCPATKDTMNQILSYDDIIVRADAEEGEVWVTQKNMATLFGKERSVITKHINSVLEEGELLRDSTCANFAQVQFEGEREVTREVEHYNLKMVIAVGYRVKSEAGTRFRIWATEQLNGILMGKQSTGEPVTERDKLWQLCYSAKTGAVQLAALAALGYALPEPAGRSAPMDWRREVTPDEWWSALAQAGRKLLPSKWLVVRGLGEDRCWQVHYGLLLERLHRAVPATRGWEPKAVARALAGEPSWREVRRLRSGEKDKQHFPGIGPARYWLWAEPGLPEEVRELFAPVPQPELEPRVSLEMTPLPVAAETDDVLEVSGGLESPPSGPPEGGTPSGER